MIALFSAQEMQEYEHVEYGESHELLRDLVKRKKDLVEMIVSEKQRLNHPSRAFCKLEIQAHIDFMSKQITEIEMAIKNIIDKDDDLNKKSKIIESVPGIGKATAAMLLAEMPELGKMENKKSAALVGVAPYTQQSGQYKGKSFISGGRASVRSAIYMAALVASRFNPAMKEFYNRLRIVGKKPAKVALVAVMRKLITILNVMIKNQAMWHCKA
jgi:transposase